ncbi:hypothetical protein IQ259_17370 [Fortiea sp. LEGE XX443]|uniref:hypothetical protein n=1 Tax=Fortiea sp. LEGE XX443 TaxID=1828611 RepID=UPI0018823319|nr:hypothetical protein [Fortiea sp. LEGE XX443]MBE9006787.1 hypothetical protein [Fortiea sp. LEGE XX443]
MDVPDIFKGFESVGKWESFEWGCRWELTNDEIDTALAKIDVERNAYAALGGVATIVSGVIAPGVGAMMAGGITGSILALYELMKSRIKSVRNEDKIRSRIMRSAGLLYNSIAVNNHQIQFPSSA